MDLVAEHRLRMLRTSDAFCRWQSLQKAQPNASSKLSIKIEQVLEVRGMHTLRHFAYRQDRCSPVCWLGEQCCTLQAHAGHRMSAGVAAADRSTVRLLMKA